MLSIKIAISYIEIGSNMSQSHEQASLLHDSSQDTPTITVEAKVSPEIKNMIDKIQNHIEGNRVNADNKRHISVDGGYDETQNRGALARPGATAGYVEALLSYKKNHPQIEALNSVQKCLDLVVTFNQSKGMKFSFHTDQHADPQSGHETHTGNKPILGCGHCVKPLEYADDYGVAAEDVKELISLMRKGVTEKPDVFEMVALNRDHAEQAALVITGTTYTVNAWDTAKNQQFFIYDKARDDAWITEFVEFLHAQRIDMNAAEYKAILNQQTDTTLALLAPGKDVYTANVDGESPIITYAQKIPVISELRQKRKVA